MLHRKLGSFTSSQIYRLHYWYEKCQKWTRQIASLAGAKITAEDIKVKPSNVVLPEKYSDFTDIFYNAKANILPGYSRHDLATKTENNKISLFELVYNHSKPD